MPEKISVVQQGHSKRLLSIFLLCEMIAALIYLFGESRILMLFETTVAILLSLLVLKYPSKQTKKIFFGTIAASFIIWLIYSIIVSHRHSYYYVPYAPSIFINIYSSILIAFLFVFYSINVKLLKLFYYSVIGFFIFARAILQIPFEKITGLSSAAYLGIIIMAFIIPIVYLEYRDKHRISFLPLLLQAFLFLFVSSRTTLGYSVMLLVASLYVVVQTKSKNMFVRLISYTLIIGVVLLVLYLIISSNSSLAIVEKFQDKGTDSNGRELIWANYFDKFTLEDMLWGRDIEVSFYDSDSFQNAHNSWIQFHSQTGFLALVYIGFILWMIVYYLLKEPFYAYIILSLVLLSSFNYVFFFKTTDWAIYLFVFEYLRIKDMPKQLKQRIKLSFF